MAVRQKDGRWVVEFEQSGIRVFRRLPAAATKAQAVELETLLRRDIFDQRQLRKAPELTLEACVELWLKDTLAGKKDQRMPEQNLEHLRPFLKGKTVRSASDAAREASKAWMAAGLAGATINRRLAVLKAALGYAYKQDWVDTDYRGKISMQRESAPREFYLTVDEVRTLASKMTSIEGRRAVILLAYTGMRASELLSPLLQVSSTSIFIPAEVTKTGKSRTVPVPLPVRPLLSALPLALSYRQLEWQFRAARASAGMPHIHLHDLRHTCASWLVNKGAELSVIGRILGHQVLATTGRYAHIADQTAARAMRRLK